MTAKAWVQGEISASAARTITQGRRAGHEAVYAAMEDELVGFAAGRDFRGLDALIRRYHVWCDALDDEEPADDNGVFMSQVGNRWALKGDHDALSGAIINEAINAGTDNPIEGDDRSPAQRRADGLVRVCRQFLDRGDAPIEDGERPHVTISMKLETLRSGELETDGDLALSPAQIGRVLCDAKITPIILDTNGNPLDVGATTYRPSRKLRSAVLHRDRRRCRFPGCDRRHGEIHHVVAFPDGQTVPANLVFLCDFHHHVLHKPGWRATFDGITFTVTNPDGRLLTAA